MAVTEKRTQLKLNYNDYDDYDDYIQPILDWKKSTQPPHLQAIKDENDILRDTIKTKSDEKELIIRELNKEKNSHTETIRKLDETKNKLEDAYRKLEKADNKLTETEKQLSTTQENFFNEKDRRNSLQIKFNIQAEKANKQPSQSQFAEANVILSQEYAQLKDQYDENSARVCAMSVTHAKYSGMHVDDDLLLCTNNFKTLRDNDLLNVAFSITDDEKIQDVLFPLLTKNGFHNFWNIISPERQLTREAKVSLSGEIRKSEKKAYIYADLMVQSTLDALASYKSLHKDFRDKTIKFFASCARWHADMTLCEPPMELLPRNLIPKKGSPINNIFGQQFDWDFGTLGFPVVESVPLPGLMIHDFNGTILVKAQITCSFGGKK